MALGGFEVLAAQTIPHPSGHEGSWVCHSLSTRGLGGVFRWGFTGRKPVIFIREKLEEAREKLSLLVRAVLVLILMKNEDFRAPPHVLLPGTALPQGSGKMVQFPINSQLILLAIAGSAGEGSELSVPATKPTNQTLRFCSAPNLILIFFIQRPCKAHLKTQILGKNKST